MDSPPQSDISLAREQRVHSTISQDFSQGRLARETAALQTLAKKPSNAQEPKAEAPKQFSQQEDVQPDPFVHSGPSPRELREAGLRSIQNSGTYQDGLKDYQMQLLLLEQQNKKGLLMKRQQPQSAPPPLPQQQPLEIPIPKIGTAWPENSSMSGTAMKRKRRSTEDKNGCDHEKMIESERPSGPSKACMASSAAVMEQMKVLYPVS